MSKQGVIIGTVGLAMALLGNLIGVAFSTGRAVLTYYVNFGRMGLVGMAMAYSLLFLCAPISYITSRNMDKYTFDWLNTPLGWKPLRLFHLYVTLLGLFSSVSAMIAASGAILQSLFNIPYIVGTMLMIAAAVVTVCFSLKRLAETFSLMVPVMVVGAIVICVICTLSPVVEGSGWESVSSNNPLLGNWWIAAFVNFGVCFGSVVQHVGPMSKENIKNAKSVGIAAVICAVVLISMGYCIGFAVVKNYSICSVADLPTVAMAYAKSPVYGIIFGVIALIAIYTTLATFLHIFKASFGYLKPLKESPVKLNFAVAAVALLGFAASFIGFSNIVDRVWAVLGYTAYLSIAGLFFNFFYYRKHPQNRLTAVDNVELAPMPAEAN
jgi:uncharacterized membrane protein YkvI